MAGPLRVEHDVSVARWLPAALADDGSVAVVVPPIFEAYVRILHPASLEVPTGETDAWGNPEFASHEITWAEAASLIGDRLGERQPWTLWLRRFGEVSDVMPDGGTLVEGHTAPVATVLRAGASDELTVPAGSRITEPFAGDIPIDLLARLARLLLEHGAVAGGSAAGAATLDAEVLVAVWEGRELDVTNPGAVFGWFSDEPVSAAEQRRLQREAQAAHEAATRAAIDPEVTRAMRAGHVLGLPREQQGRGHVLLRGQLAALADPIWQQTAGLAWRADRPSQGRTPNAIWPSEPTGAPAWFVATELDLDCTLVGGSAELISRLEADPAFETERIRPADTLIDR